MWSLGFGVNCPFKLYKLGYLNSTWSNFSSTRHSRLFQYIHYLSVSALSRLEIRSCKRELDQHSQMAHKNTRGASWTEQNQPGVVKVQQRHSAVDDVELSSGTSATCFLIIGAVSVTRSILIPSRRSVSVLISLSHTLFSLSISHKNKLYWQQLNISISIYTPLKMNKFVQTTGFIVVKAVVRKSSLDF